MVLDFAYALLEVSDLIPFLLSYFLLGVAGCLPYLFLRVSDRPVEFVYPVAQPVFVAVAAILVRSFFFHDSMFFTLNNREGLSSAVHAVDVRIDRGDILFDGPFGDDLVRVLLGSPRNRRRVARRQLRSGADMLRVPSSPAGCRSERSYFFCSFPMRFFDSFRFGRLTSFLGTTFVPQFSRRFVSEALPALLNGYTCRSDAVEICCRNRNTRTAGFGVSSYFRRSCPDAGDKGRGSDHGLSAGP